MELGIPELTSEEIETLCSIGENAARKFVRSKINQKLLEKLDISIDIEGNKPVNVTVEVDIMLSPENRGFDEKKLAEGAVKEAFEAIESYLRKLK